MSTLYKVYKTKKLEFRQSSSNPWIYIGYIPNSNKVYEEMCAGWGWTLAAFSEQQLEELENWSNEESMSIKDDRTQLDLEAQLESMRREIEASRRAKPSKPEAEADKSDVAAHAKVVLDNDKK